MLGKEQTTTTPRSVVDQRVWAFVYLDEVAPGKSLVLLLIGRNKSFTDHDGGEEKQRDQ